MQLYARASQNTLTFASQATKHTDYTCIECSQVVRLRSGIHRQPHFYHLRPNESCHQHGKSMTHLMLQCHLQQLLPESEALLECRFPSINRIADVAWHKQKIIFEIQCSPITAEEILSRNADYASLGFRVIWILHDSRFNQWRISAAENILDIQPYYFTNMDSEGIGIIYEQLSVVHCGIRKERAMKLPVNLCAPKIASIEIDQNYLLTHLPKLAFRKIQSSSLHFEGDTIYHCTQYFQINTPLTEYLQSLAELELRWYHLFNTQNLSSMSLGACIKLLWKQWIIAPYCSVLRLILEKACR